MKEINDNIFDKEVIENEKPVVVDFWVWQRFEKQPQDNTYHF